MKQQSFLTLSKLLFYIPEVGRGWEFPGRMLAPQCDSRGSVKKLK